ncbi:MAG TPA: cytochrome c3 family protein, partial [Piscinibacter sp.]|nr:cytochrome c3 family protein [Piscinibacter sp.]
MTHRPALDWPLAALLRRWLLLLLLAGSSLAMAQGAPATHSFEHIKTGFALTGQHANERCESCHVGGVFKGTPRDCASCHVSGTRWSRNNVVKNQNHFPTQQACDTCHGTQSYTGAKFNHAGVTPGACTSCHNGSMAPGKNSSHIQTTASCDTCHKTSGWTPASGFDHSGVVQGTCATCHNGSRATGKSATHVPVGSQSCDACHRTGGSWKPSSFNHTQMVVANQCSSCHSGGFPPADGRNANHIPYQSLAGAAITNCDSCHKSGFSSWTPARFHASVSVSTQCASCHTGGFARAVGKPNTAIHAGVTVCETCHKSTTSWAGAKVDHSTFTTATNCTTCHNGSTATGKSATHVPVAATNCVSCHSVTTWRPTTFNHS